MSTVTERLVALQRSLEAARDIEHPPLAIPSPHREQAEQHLQGLRAGLQIAIDAIGTELLMVAAYERAMEAHGVPA